jgi:hypothetical protein
MLNKKALATSASVAPKVFVEDVFSTYLYSGNGSTQTITNGIDLAGKGGLVWTKWRSGVYGAISHALWDTTRGVRKSLASNLTSAEAVYTTDGLTAFNSNGFSVSSTVPETYTANGDVGTNYCSWTFREQPKFFDVVTYTGNDVSGRLISHNLGSIPGMIIIRSLSVDEWWVWHRSISTGTLSSNTFIRLNLTNGQATGISSVIGTVNASTFEVGTSSNVNWSSRNYVAYVFAHDAGGFGESGTDNVISCGSYTGTGATQTIALGYEAQYVLIKNASSNSQWAVLDVMRGMPLVGNTPVLYPNTPDAQDGVIGTGNFVNATATGFIVNGAGGVFNGSGDTYIYMAIRRPMKVPTTGTSVFSPIVRNGNSVNPTVVTTPNFAVDMQISTERTKTVSAWNWAVDKLRGTTPYLATNRQDSEYTYTDAVIAFTNLGFNLGDGALSNTAGGSYVYWNFRRASGFFDVVCYTGNSVAGATQTHNLGVTPELIIVKPRSLSQDWTVYNSFIGPTKALYLNNTIAASTDGTAMWNNTAPTSTVFSLGTNVRTNNSGTTYVAYLFATCAGVSKVGSYTGNGGTQAIACGFTGGARFVLIKRTDSTGDWYVYDTARGMTTVTDPYLLLNSSATEAATLGSVTTTTGGFTVNASILSAINTNGASYIFLAIA